jgi:hypothetical protein
MNTSIQFTRLNNDINGNPRYVCHYLTMAPTYEAAVKLANSIGGRKYNNKTYGGGLVFQSYSLSHLITHINRVAGTIYLTYSMWGDQ